MLKKGNIVKRINIFLLFFSLILVQASIVKGDVRLLSVISDSIVLQSDMSALTQSPNFTGFEAPRAGPLSKVTFDGATWSAPKGHAEISARLARTGRQCLHLNGGDHSEVEFILSDVHAAKQYGQLSFAAERWTKREPFSFRIEVVTTNGNWQEIYNGDDEVKVGRAYRNHVVIALPPNVRRLRMTCSAPPKTGVLIDDMVLVEAKPMEVSRVFVKQEAVPILIGRENSPLLQLVIETEGSLSPVMVTAVEFELRTRKRTLSQIRFRNQSIKPETKVFFETEIPLAAGVNVLPLTCVVSPDASLDDYVLVACTGVHLDDKHVVTPDSALSSVHRRIGIALRQRGQDNVHTYRIPGLATTNRGTLIGVYDIRRRGSGDLPGDIDIGMSRSTDGGRTWEPMKVIMDMGNDPQWRYDGIGDPAVLVDRNTGTIWVAATWSHGNRSWRGSGPGLKPEETGQLMLARSDDDGVTWSEPINITEQVKRPEWCFLLQGPGKGITMRDGTIVFAAQYQDPPEQKRLPHSTIMYSKDHGRTWQVGTGAFDDTTESQVVEIEPGVLMLNCRYNRKPVRVVMTTRDMGKTWQKHITSERTLIEPGACMASLIDVDREVGKDLGGWLLFSNPDSTRGRNHITIKASCDRGLTWPKEHRLLLDEGTGAGYSCMSMIDDRTVGILYEGSQAHLTFQQIPLKVLFGKERSQKSAASGTTPRLCLPRVFGSHMVLQADAKIPVWGSARPGEEVTVSLSNETGNTKANERGEWQLHLKPREASAVPIKMQIESADERIEFRNVTVGEVWICAGQSNMDFALRHSIHGKEELAAADHPNLRLLHLSGGARGSHGSYTPQHIARLTPDTFCEGRWKGASAESAGAFSAVSWYFGRQLEEKLNVPVGLICPAVGGTPTEAWIPREALEADPDLRGLVAGNWLDNKRLGEFCRTRGQQNLLRAIQAGEAIPGDEFGPNHSFKPGFMWSAGIEPLIPYAIRGVIWYQGESNAETPARVLEHGRLFPLLIRQWREQWAQGDFPFLYVQLPAINRSEWPAFRNGQRQILDQVENVAMAVTLDIGHPTNVHPPLKKPVGQRLAIWALGTVYQKDLVYSGPLYRAITVKGDTATISFDHVGSGLKTDDNAPPRHFEIAGDNGEFHSAQARIDGDKVIVRSPFVPQPRSVRYAWLPFPEPPVNLVNSVGLPASPFLTGRDQDAPATMFKRGDL